jgi:diaminohydroxyphosphoribosylaminopyrimidine deaminase / 5-amino-6-(5-phosphoribosylamino)uracil reductase
MQQTDTARAQIPQSEPELDPAWSIVRAAARNAERLAESRHLAAFAIGEDEQLRQLDPDDADALIEWRPGVGWEAVLPPDDPRYGLIDLYLPICSATAAQPITVGHLGQSLDGFIATHAGESRWVTGQENILHLHRLRALCDAVVVGAGTVAVDDPQLTTRLVSGPNPLRVVLDPGRRLGDHHRVFNDDEAETLYVCARSLTRPGERQFGRATVVGLPESEVDRPQGGTAVAVPESVDVAALIRLLRARGCSRIFVEGGGVTVSMFLEANQLDRLQMAIAPLIIGDGRPAIRLPAREVLGDCQRPRYRVFRMGGDVLFDCDLRAHENEASYQPPDTASAVTRVI